MGRKKVNYQQVGYVDYLGTLYINNRWFNIIHSNNSNDPCSDICRYGDYEWMACYKFSYESIGLKFTNEDFCAFYHLLNKENNKIALKPRSPYSLYKAIRFKIKSKVKTNNNAIRICKFK